MDPESGMEGSVPVPRFYDAVGILRSSAKGTAKPAGSLAGAVSALRSGKPAGAVSEGLHWKDFEGLAAVILDEKGYDTRRNLILGPPRVEIDVVGTRSDTAILVDCKHWKGSVPKSVAARQIVRAHIYAEQNPGCGVIPVVMTLYEQSTLFAYQVPVVPVERFASFVDDIPGHLDHMRVIRAAK